MKLILRSCALFITLIMWAFSLDLSAQEYKIDHIDPPMWWTDMKNPELMLMIHGKGISSLEPRISYPGVELKTTTRSDNPNYLFLSLDISADAHPGTINIDFLKNGKSVYKFPYILKERKEGSAIRKSFTNEDVIYLLMPDRFANGDTSNDSSPALKEKVNRKDLNGRHGGDIKGIIDHLDYLKNLGITAIWPTPLLEDDEARYSYHTYAITDYYKIDERYGSNADYVKLADECHKRGMKLIMDMVPNHCGIDHWWMKDMPMKDWFHQFPEFTRSNYTFSTWNDPHGSEYDKKINADGWFDVTMPDLNQLNPFVLTYFKQFAIFWIEYAGLDGLRVDTYPYNDKVKIAEWSKAIRDEYPSMNIVGECWEHNPAETAYWQSGSANFDHYDSQIPAVMDFPLLDALQNAFNSDGRQGVMQFYKVYALDYLYKNPENLVIFADNHDSQRFSQQIGFDIKKFKMGMAHLLTTRGIPEIYTGTEILMGGEKNKGDGDIRRDFPGGWPRDQANAFTSQGRTKEQNEAFEYLQKLLNYRKANPVLQNGRMIQFLPFDGLYVYFRINNEKTIMVILNNSTEKSVLKSDRFEECLKGRKQGTDVIDGKVADIEGLELQPKSATILEIK